MNICSIGIHPDDSEVGCGGALALCSARGDAVHMVDLSRGESSSNGTPQEREAEAAAAARILGCSDRRCLGLPDAGIHSEDPVQQRAVVAAIRDLRPQLLLAPSADDPHPDHASGAVLVLRAVYLAGIRGYASGGAAAWKVPTVLLYSGRREVRPDLVVAIDDFFETKMEAIRAHTTQFGRSKESRDTPLNRPDFLAVIEARARICGQRIGVRYGEAFAPTETVRLDDFGVFEARP